MTEKKINILLLLLGLCFFITLLLVIYNTRYVGGQVVNQTVSIDNTTEQETKINLNTATRTELMLLPNIGPKLADKIIEYRKEHEFQSISELVNIRGIGERLYEGLEGRITVE